MLIIIAEILPLLAFLTVFIKINSISSKFAINLIITSLIVSTCLCLNIGFENLYLPKLQVINLGNWFTFGLLKVDFIFYIDSLTITMCSMICFISLCVHIYSLGYMKNDQLPLFLAYLSLFTFFMLLLVTAGNFVIMFFGWEGVGLSSYILINFWHTRIAANKAAVKAILVNKIGDCFLLLAIATLFYSFYSLDYLVLFTLAPYAASFPHVYINILGCIINPIDISCLFILGGACAKSAQFILHTWLPDAMEGPSPVSALIHAATMVTAGIFLLVRVSPLLEYSPQTLFLCVMLGSITAFFASTVALFQFDIKKIIAFSTCSQLGYMLFACGLSSYDFAMFHLFNHAFFKALLFLSAGAVIHSMSDEQDIRRMGGLSKLLPLSYVAILCGSFSLAGIPFSTGFYSKDAILETAYSSHGNVGLIAFWFGVFSALCTAAYSARLIYLVFLSTPGFSHKTQITIHESPLVMAIPLIILSLCSIFIGYNVRDIFIGLGSQFWGVSIYILPKHLDHMGSLIPIYIKCLLCIIIIFGLILSSWAQMNLLGIVPYVNKVKTVYSFAANKWYFDHIYNKIIVKLTLHFSETFIFNKIERGVLELLLPGRINQLINIIMYSYHNIVKYYIQQIVLYILLGFCLLGLFIIIDCTINVDFYYSVILVLILNSTISKNKKHYINFFNLKITKKQIIRRFFNTLIVLILISLTILDFYLENELLKTMNYEELYKNLLYPLFN